MKKLFFLFVCILCLSQIGVGCSMNMQGIEVLYEPPTAKEFVNLRAAVGMRERKISSAEKGIPNSVFWIILRHQGNLIGMGRVVGDGGTVVQITDIAVDPEYQRKGYGSFIFDRIQEFILAEIPDDAFVCLFAEKEMAPFYKNRGFEFSQEKWPGMYWPCLDRIKINAQQ
jgi:N-acetylglutamate synthase-like GNAT family acetyltransferase